MTEHILPGLRPTPLGSYLAGLGLFRVLAEQADPRATARSSEDGLVIESTVESLADWLVDDYAPTPIVSPWKRGTGFGPKDRTPREAVVSITKTTGPRLEPLREAIVLAQAISDVDPPNAGINLGAVRQFRNRCRDDLVPWVDAAVIVGTERAFFPPILGTGGGDGALDFSTNFHQRLLEVLDEAPQARQRSLSLASDVLTGMQSQRLQPAAIGQFDPAAAGGRNSSPYGGAESLVNPWAYILLVEGALLFAASAVRRHQHAAGRAAVPFTVFASPDASPSGAENEQSRGEVWTPVWDRPFTLAEVRQLFAEARASWNGRPAQRAVEFYAATRSLGVARGVGSFIRYGLHQRNGLAFVAVPIERVEVRAKPEVRLAARLEEWVSWVRRGESSTAVRGALRRFDAAHMRFVRDGGPENLGRLLAAVTDLEMTVGRSRRAKESVQTRKPPPARDFLATLRAVECPELRVAVGIASCAGRPGADPVRQPARTMRELLLPVDPGGRWRDAPVVPGFGLRQLECVLADVLAWRCRTAADEQDSVSFRGAPTFRYGMPVPAADLHDFALGRLDSEALELWLRACLALHWQGVPHLWSDDDRSPDLPVATLGMLHALAAGLASEGAEPGTPRLALNPDWAVRLAAGQLGAVHPEAARRLRQAGWEAAPLAGTSTVDGPAVAAALVPRCHKPRRLLARHFAIEIRTDETVGNTPEPEEVML